ncbi:MAG TPA: NB-ARC domain-containing protein [Fimbriimonadaceae bacterium]|nr:NB-ARC domain-containing protein [Fimbriimonadaceae bacterium]
MRYKENQSRLSAVVALGSPLGPSGDDPLVGRIADQLAARVMPQFGGKETLFGAWIFSSATSATIAAHEVYRLCKDDLVLAVLTGETESSGASRGLLSERAKEICHATERPGVYVCPATQLIAVDNLPADLWFLDAGQLPVQSGGVEHVYALCHGEEEASVKDALPRRSLVPRPPNSFVGRQEDLQKVAQILSQWFLVTVTGLPGSGKSVLAMVLAIALGDDYPDGVFWMDVSTCKSEGDLLRKLQKVTSHGRSKRIEPLSVLADRLSGKHALLVFDNAEGFVEELKRITEALISPTTSLGILVTSTIALRTSHEHVYSLGPLSIPERGKEYTVLKEYNSDALGLLADRAQAVREDFGLVLDNVEMAADICRALSGNPLAIEIAASKMAGRTLRSLERQLTKALTFRNETPLRPHHASIKQALMRPLLTMPTEQIQLLKELCLFAGPFPLEWADLIWVEAPEVSTLDETLAQLVRRSLLAFDGERGRYEVPAILRLLLSSQAGYAAEVHGAKLRFCRYMFDVTRRGRALFDENREDEALSLLDLHYSEILAALRYACAMPELRAEAPDLLLTLPHYWSRRNLIINCDQIVSFVLEAGDVTESQRAQMLILMGAARMMGHDYEAARKYYAEAKQHSDDIVVLHRINGNLGLTASYLGHYDESYGYFEEALRLGLEDGDRARVSNVALTWADALGQWVDTAPPHHASTLLNKADSLVELAKARLGDDPGPFWQDSINNVEALLSWCRGDMRNAWKFYVLAALASEATHCEAEAAVALERLGIICAQQGRYQDAAKFAGLAIQIRVNQDRPRKPIDEKRFDDLMEALSHRLGKERLREYCDYGASLTISDLCVLT